MAPRVHLLSASSACAPARRSSSSMSRFLATARSSLRGYMHARRHPCTHTCRLCSGCCCCCCCQCALACASPRRLAPPPLSFAFRHRSAASLEAHTSARATWVSRQRARAPIPASSATVVTVCTQQQTCYPLPPPHTLPTPHLQPPSPPLRLLFLETLTPNHTPKRCVWPMVTPSPGG